MSKQRSGAPVAAPVVPWGAPTEQPAVEDAQVDALTIAFESAGDTSQEPTEESSLPPQTERGPADAFADRVKAAFSGEVQAQKSVFAPKPKAQVAPEPEPFPMGDAPSWGDLVRFVQKHGNLIIQVRYPQPKGECIDTLYRGVTVFRHETCQLRHNVEGWIDWADAQYE